MLKNALDAVEVVTFDYPCRLIVSSKIYGLGFLESEFAFQCHLK